MLPLASSSPMANPHPLTHSCRWGLLGLSQIAVNYAAPAIAATANNEIVAVATTHPEKGKSWALNHPGQRIYSSYEELLQDRQIDAIYLSLPHRMHHAWALAAINTGKHLLIEKPLALTRKDAQAIYTAAQAAHVLVWEGFMWRHQVCLPEILQIATNPQHPL